MFNSFAARPARFRLLDLVKAIGASLIVLHHLAFYGPMSDFAEPLAPGLLAWLSDHARVAVQLFFVTGGFLAARALAPGAQAGIRQPLQTILRRYIKLAPPFFVATLIAIPASALASLVMDHATLVSGAGIGQLAAHAFLLQSVLGYDALWAGAWYVAIDFQLYALLTLLLWCAGRLAPQRSLPWLMPLLMTGVAGASLFYFNRLEHWDVWAPYFIGSYGLGVLAWWAVAPGRSPLASALIAGAMLVLGAVALEMDFRSRIAVALGLSLLLVLVYRTGLDWSQRRWPALAFLGKISYAMFLVHFPVCLVVNALFVHFAPHTPGVQACGMLAAWLASIAAGAAFHRWIELPLAQHITLRRAPLFIPTASPLLQRYRN